MGSEEPSGALGRPWIQHPGGRAHGPSGPWVSPCWALGPATVRDELETRSLYLMVQSRQHQEIAY